MVFLWFSYGFPPLNHDKTILTLINDRWIDNRSHLLGIHGDDMLHLKEVLQMPLPRAGVGHLRGRWPGPGRGRPLKGWIEK